MDAEQIVEELETIARQLEVEVRRERGSFRGGHCQMGESAYIILNKRHPSEAHLAILAASLQHYPLDTVYIKPAVRAALEEVWTASGPEETRAS